MNTTHKTLKEKTQALKTKIVRGPTPGHCDLFNYRSGEFVRPATADEREASDEAAKTDNGVGAFIGNDGVTYWVQP